MSDKNLQKCCSKLTLKTLENLVVVMHIRILKILFKGCEGKAREPGYLHSGSTPSALSAWRSCFAVPCFGSPVSSVLYLLWIKHFEIKP